MEFQILADAVKDNDRIVDRISDDRQECRDKRRVDLTLGKREYREHDNDIVDERKHRRYAETPLKAVGDVEDDECP